MTVQRMTRISLLTAASCAGSILVLPIGGVPVTLQVFFVLLSGFLLGSKDGFIAQFLYIMIGLAGLPVFAGGRGGAGMIFSPTFGFILAFPIAAFISGRINDNLKKDVLIIFSSLMTIYCFGLLIFVINAKINIIKGLSIAILPFIPFDILKGVLAYYLYKKLKRPLKLETNA